MKEKQVHFAGASFCVCNRSNESTEGMNDDRFFCKYNSMHCWYRKKIFYITVLPGDQNMDLCNFFHYIIQFLLRILSGTLSE